MSTAMTSHFRPFLLLIVLLFPLVHATSEPMTLEGYYEKFVLSSAFDKAKKDVQFFAETFYEDPVIFVYDYKVIMNCLSYYEEGNSNSIASDKCYKGEVFFKVEFQMKPDETLEELYSVGYVSGVIDFEDAEVSNKTLPPEASFYGPLNNRAGKT